MLANLLEGLSSSRVLYVPVANMMEFTNELVKYKSLVVIYRNETRGGNFKMLI